MARLQILEFPDPRLRIKARPVERFDEDLKILIANMFETMYAAPGIGLAATQVDVHRRLLVADVSDEHNQPLAFVNPRIIESSGKQVHEEGCLSVPEFCAKVTRAEQIRVAAQDADGREFEISADGLLAVCLQHEMDHLDGKLFVDYLSPLKREMLRKRMDKLRQRQLEASL